MARPDSSHPDVATIAELLGNAPRAAMVTSLMGDFARPASELAAIAGVSRPTASEHLARLVAHDLLTVERVGRNAYYRIAGRQVAELVESLAVIAPVAPPTSLRSARLLTTLGYARTCYRHLAGRVGVALADALRAQKLVRQVHNGLEVDRDRWDERRPLGLAATVRRGEKQPAIKGCVDWSERRHHLAGSLATSLTERMFQLEWIARAPGHPRAVVVTAEGLTGLRGEFGLAVR